ncbi:MAG TPA: hypothetical protein VGL81_16320 [Polyangiaceae bacterium]
MRKGALILASGMVGVACSVTTINPYGEPPFPGTASQVVGAGGGIVTTNDGTTLLIPPNALSADVTITIGLDATPPELSVAQTVTSGHVFGPAGQTFAVPVCITLSFEPRLLPEGGTEENVVLYQTRVPGPGYGLLETMATDRTHVTGMTTSLSEVVAAFGQAREVDAGPDGDTCDGSDIEAGEAGM